MIKQPVAPGKPATAPPCPIRSWLKQASKVVGKLVKIERAHCQAVKEGLQVARKRLASSSAE